MLIVPLLNILETKYASPGERIVCVHIVDRLLNDKAIHINMNTSQT
jgi:hypothetical protein